MRYISIPFAIILLCSCAAQPTPETATEVLNTIPELKPPLNLGDSLFEAVDTTKEFSNKEFELLNIVKIVNPVSWEHYKYIPVGKISLNEKCITLLLHQFNIEQSRGYLINYARNGEYIEYLEVYQDNSEGALWTDSFINKQNEITISEGSIYVNDGEPDVKVFIINNDGQFIPKPK